MKANNKWVNEDSSGRNPKISCPFHSDSTPSLYIYESKNFHCYSCGRNGRYLNMVHWYSELVQGSDAGFYQVVNNVLAGDRIMQVAIGYNTIYQQRKETIEELSNFKIKRFQPSREFKIHSYKELSTIMKKEGLTDDQTVVLAILYAQRGYPPTSVYHLIKNEAPSEVADVFDGMDIDDILNIDFNIEVD